MTKKSCEIKKGIFMI